LLEIFVSVQTELSVIGEIGTELQEKGPKVLIDAVEVVMIHEGGGLDDPGIGAFCLRIAPFFGALDGAFLLGFADEDNAFPVAEVFALLFGKVVFALSFLKGDERNPVVLGKALDGVDELASDRLHHVSGCDFMSALDPYELQCTFDGLELGYIHIEVHPIDALHFQHHVLAQYLGDSLWYAHRGSGCGVPSQPGDSP